MESRIVEIGLALGVGLCCACDPGDPELEAFREGALVQGGQHTQARAGGGGTWLGNGLEEPDISGLDLAYVLNPGHGLRADGGLLTTADGLELARYAVECALPEGDSISKNIDGSLVVLHGALGLAPEWKTETCDEACQEWVSACLLARTNSSGQTVDLWITADHDAIGFGFSPEYPVLEAAFYGNLFQDPDARYFCHGGEEGLDAALAEGRTCTSDGDCGFTSFGDCFEPDRCAIIDGLFPTDCARDDPATGPRHRSLAVFVAAPDEEVP